ncbi:MAG: CHAT domain-containing protein [Deltaproteobacteria bacterium]|nr:CHAT domain-containing protein [Deltaproteobacteria bacterium]
MTSHRKMVASGLLRGDLDEATRRKWPSWARQHAARCPRCRALIETESILEEAYLVLQGKAPTPPPPQPSIAYLRARMAQRQPPGLGDLTEDRQAFPSGRFRAVPLEVEPTAQGIGAWHPLARMLAFYVVRPGHLPLLLRVEGRARPGIWVDVPLEPGGPRRVVVLAAQGSIDPLLWGFWLADWLRAHPDAVTPPYDTGNHVHFAWLTLPSTDGRPVPFTGSPTVSSSSVAPGPRRQARSTGQRECRPSSADAFRGALASEKTEGEQPREERALGALAQACLAHGLIEDAEHILDLPGHLTQGILERKAYRAAVESALARDHQEAAEAWVDRARADPGLDPAVSAFLALQLVQARGRWQEAEEITATLNEEALPEASRSLLRFIRAEALASLGRPTEARACLSRAAPSAQDFIAASLHRSLAEAAIALAEGRSFDWSSAAYRASQALWSEPAGISVAEIRRMIVEVATRACTSGDADAARVLLRLRFLHPSAAIEPGHRLLAAACCPERCLLVRPEGSVEALPFGRPALAALVRQARHEMQAGLPQRALPRLADLILPSGPPSERLLVASDCSLSEIPLFGLLARGLAREAPLPPVLDLLDVPGPVHTEGVAPGGKGIASIADADGDLPGAGREVLRQEAVGWFRGENATTSRIRKLPPVGLLHLGLHATGDRGAADLLFADGPMSTPEIAALSLPSRPVVLLSGCTTLANSACPRVGRSVASAFLAAGASAVVTVRWPVLDREMRLFARTLVSRWPFEDVPLAVAEAITALRSRGASQRLWATPVVYGLAPV